MPELLNQPFTLAKWWPQALVICQCKKDQGIIVAIILTGVGNRTLCDYCKKGYYIQGFAMAKEGPAMIVNFDLPAPERLM